MKWTKEERVIMLVVAAITLTLLLVILDLNQPPLY
jgi:hypothetical protein